MLRIYRDQRSKLRQNIDREILSYNKLLDEQISPNENEDLKHELDACIGLMSDLQTKYETLSSQIVEEITEFSDEEIDEEIEFAAESIVKVTLLIMLLSAFRAKVDHPKAPVRLMVNAAVAPKEPANYDLQAQIAQSIELETIRARNVAAPAAPATPIKIPVFQIDKFSGDVLGMHEFWHSFYAAIHQHQGLQPVKKVTYLRSKLNGEAKNLVSGLVTINENYEVAVQLLRNRYGNPQALILAHINQIVN